MKKIITNKDGKPVYTIGIIKAGKGQKIKWKPEVIPHWKSLHTLNYDSDRHPTYKSDSLYVPMFCQVFWLGLIFYIKVHTWKLGEGRMINYNDSHYAEIDDALKVKQ
jgi:hypothetical protein